MRIFVSALFVNETGEQTHVTDYDAILGDHLA